MKHGSGGQKVVDRLEQQVASMIAGLGQIVQSRAAGVANHTDATRTIREYSCPEQIML
jgi:hypothetical protein